MIADFHVLTDTSTLCVFDIQCAKHRLTDDADWWSIREDEVHEVNEGNIAFLGVRTDGVYRVVVSEVAPEGVRVHLNCPSGRIFIGAAENVTSDGLEPEDGEGGVFLQLPPGPYLLSAAKTLDQVIVINLEKLEESAQNSFREPIDLPILEVISSQIGL